MRSICQLSRRWHQQFCGSPSFTGHQRCLQHLQPVRYLRQTTKDRRSNPLRRIPRSDDLVVREYEQDVSDPKRRRRIDPKAEVREEGKLIRAHLAELDKELAVLRQGPFGPQSPFIRSLSSDDRERVLKALEEEGVLGREDEDQVKTEDLEELFSDREESVDDSSAKSVPGVTLRIPQRQKAYIKKFNSALEKAVQSFDDIPAQLGLWKWFLRCQQHVVGFSSIIPEDVWQILWKSQTTAYHRPQYIVMLAEDMRAAEVELTSSQSIAYIEAIRDDGDTAKAVATWNELRSSLGNDEAVASEFWALGVRLYATLGRPQKAQDLAFECLEHSSVVKPDILIPVIWAWAKSKSESSREKAWACYLKLRVLMGDQITVEVYESVSRGLLHAKQFDLALAVFKDMMLQKERSADDSTTVYRTALDYVQDLQSNAVSEEIVNRISLTALIVFPKRFQNKFFFGAWIKQLIGRGDLEGAANVVDLMIERGVSLDAKHVNGLLGAWLREGSPSSRTSAERMAWAMIHARTDMVEKQMRKEASDIDSTDGAMMRRSLGKSVRIPPFLLRAAPPANIETFSILLQHYIRRTGADSNDAEYLTNVMTGPAKIAPNAYIMNHWLYGLLRVSDVDGVWAKYCSSTRASWNKRQTPEGNPRPELQHLVEPEHTDSIQPDLETFAVLWDTGKIRYDPSRAVRSRRFPDARLLFMEMSDWMDNLSGSKLAAVKEQFSRDLYHQIIRCFCYSIDLPGIVCALHALKQRFDIFPDDDTTRLVVVHISKLLPREGVRAAGRRKAWQHTQRKAVAETASVVEAIAERHEFKLFQKGLDPQKLDQDGPEAKQLRLDVLTEFVLSVRQRTAKAGVQPGNEAVTVGKIMGVDVSGLDFSSVGELGHLWKSKRDPANEKPPQ